MAERETMRKDSLHVPPATLLALAQRAEAGGDDALSDDVWRALGWREKDRLAKSLIRYWQRPDGLCIDGPRPDVTRSLDAVEEVPGRIKEVETDTDGVVSAGAVLNKILCYGETKGENAEIRARVAAKLRALAAQKESGGGTA